MNLRNPDPTELRLVARALLFTAGEDSGGTSMETFDDNERLWMVMTGLQWLGRADQLEGRDPALPMPKPGRIRRSSGGSSPPLPT